MFSVALACSHWSVVEARGACPSETFWKMECCTLMYFYTLLIFSVILHTIKTQTYQHDPQSLLSTV